jgi:hypothetical protein
LAIYLISPPIKQISSSWWVPQYLFHIHWASCNPYL